ncbi:hypothetical protein GGF43_000209 [Coemansia sp. RSA 2618]|nr:hypothetical protein GGF43_000209 [Coemansia sp. RSA 2618]
MPQPSGSPGDIRLDPSIKSTVYHIGGVPVHFPFAPYASQLGMMNHMIRALTRAQNTMIESPTGSGKSLALLCASLAWRHSFIAKQRAMLANVEQIIMRFSLNNPMLLRSKFGKANQSDNNLSDSLGKSADKPPDTGPGQDPEATPREKGKSQEAESGEETLESLGFLRSCALAMRSETVDFILEISKTRIPDGLTDGDLEKLSSFKSAGKHVAKKPRIYFGTRTHKQVAQLVDELRRKTPYRLRTAVLGSRTQLCTHPKARRGESIDEMCKLLRDEDNCGAYSGFRRILGSNKIAAGGPMEIWDLEDIVKVGGPLTACAYYASRELATSADLVFCPYNYILDPVVRAASGIELGGNIVILDEAHNIEGAARDAGSFEVHDYQLAQLANECTRVISADILPEEHRVLRDLGDTLATWLQHDEIVYEYRDYETQTSVWPKPECSIDELLLDLALTPETIVRIKSAHAAIEEHAKEQRAQSNEMTPVDPTALQPNIQLSSGALRVVEGLLRVLEYVVSPSQFATDFRIAVERLPNPELRDFARKRKRLSMGDAPAPFVNKLAFWAMNPGVIFSEIAEQARTIVLTSGTLSPLDSYASELQVDFATKLEADHVIDASRFCAVAVEFGPSDTRLEAKYGMTDQLSFQDDMGAAIAQITARSPDGMLVFAPSYALLNKLFARWEGTGCLAEMRVHKEVFIEPQGGSREQFDKLLFAYRNHLQPEDGSPRPRRGAMMFAVYRGKVSEGIDFSDHFCRTVVNIGIPYPAYKDVKVTLKREYNDEHPELLNGKRWYEIQAFRATNQALGRCLRHKNDWGAIIMLDARFAFPPNIGKLSKWIRNHMRVFGMFGEAKMHLDAFYEARISADQAELPKKEMLDDKYDGVIVIDD